MTASPGQDRIRVGGLDPRELRAALDDAGVLLNAHAETLLQNPVFTRRAAEVVTVVERTVADLGLPDGATLPQILHAAGTRGLLPCPPDTGPYLRLALTDQVNAPDAVLSARRPPSEALTVASAPLSDDPDHPRGFYLRVVEHRPWLRGYRCDDEFVWSPADRFAFRRPD